MKTALNLACIATTMYGLSTASARAEIVAEYTHTSGSLPQDQGWTWNGAGNVNPNGDSLTVSESVGEPNFLFSRTVPVNVFYDAWSFTGNNRFASNPQEEFGQFMFADDGTNLWHMSFRNAGTQHDGIYMGGDPNGPVGGITAQAVWLEEGGSFDFFHDYTLIDNDGFGGLPPTILLDGVDLFVEATPAPSMFPAGTVGWGSLNPFENGFFQTTHMVFDGNPNAVVPEVSGDYNGDGATNAADYTVWRDGGSPDDTIAGYDLWKANFGAPGAGSGSATVPEPHSLALLAFAVLVGFIGRRFAR